MSADSLPNPDEERDIRLSALMDYVIGEKKRTLPLSDRPIKYPSLFYVYPMPTAQKVLSVAGESCIVKSVISCVLGGILGLGFGVFTASIDPQMTGNIENPPSFRETMREFKTRMIQMSKNFAFIGLFFTGTECVVDTLRGRSELLNGTIAGGITGFFIGFRGGFVPAIWSGGGFALFSTIIDYYWRY